MVSVVPDWLQTQAIVGPVPGMPGQFSAVMADIGEQALDRAEEIIHETLEKLAIDADVTEVRSGSVDTELADAVGDTGALVIGSAAARNLSAKVAGNLFGNTSEKVIHHVRGDVLVVH